MLLRELFLFENTTPAPTKKLGRAFNHLEDLVFFYGSQGTLEALSHLRELATDAGSKSVRMKWDGSPQMYWGRETKNGPLILTGHNGWSRGVKSQSSQELYDFIVNQSGNPRSPDEHTSRQKFAQEFSNMYELFDRATPKEFVGFVYGDALFLQKPLVDAEGNYSFSPNPNTDTTYHVRPDSELGQRIAKAKAMVVGHAFFPHFGMDDSLQQPIQTFDEFNKTPDLIVQGPIYNQQGIEVDTTSIDQAEEYLKQHSSQIDGFLASTSGLSDLKNIIYTFVNQAAKAKKLDDIGTHLFFNWLQTSKVSLPKQKRILDLSKQYGSALDAIFHLVSKIQHVKDNVIEQIESGHTADIWDTNGEGRVRYADQSKQFGHVKLVPRKRWTPK